MENTPTPQNNKWLRPLIIALATLPLLWPALYNGYPMVNSDAGTYLASGFIPETPMDRPITYGLLIRLLSFSGYSLWPVICAQALLIVYLMYGILKQLVGVASIKYIVPVVLLLSVLTGLPWLVCQAQPDVFTPIALLCIVLLLGGVAGKGERIWLYVLFTVSVAVHMSHPVVMAGTVVCAWLLRKLWVEPGGKPVTAKAILLVVLSAAGISVMGAALSKSKHVFIMGSLVEKGVVKQYLDDNCATKNYRLCAYKDQLPTTLNEFIWVNSSPLYKVGDWKGTKQEFNAIIHDVETTPKYLKMFAVASVKATGQQLAAFGMGDGNTPFDTGSVLGQRVALYIPGEAHQFQSSRQNKGTLLDGFHAFNIVHPWVVVLSVLIILVYVNRSGRRLRLVLIVCIAGILLNAADTAALSCVQDRYGCRAMWLVPFCAMCCLAGKGNKKK